MLRSRHLATCFVLLLGITGAFAPSAIAAEGISGAKALGGDKTATSVTTSGGGSTKETLAISTLSPLGGQTISGSVPWEVAVQAGAPTKIEFAVDGTVKWTDTAAPYTYGSGSGGSFDTTKLANGSHTLSATAYGSKGVKATSKVVVKVANKAVEPAPEPAPEPTPGTGDPIYWGATIGTHLTGNQAPWDMTAVSKYEELAKKPMSLIHFYQPFANCSSSPCSFYQFPKGALESVRLHGSIPVLSWASQSTPSSVNEPDFQLSDVISGRYDPFLRQFAEAAKAWGHPFFLRFNFEMNGRWFPWSEGVNGNKAGGYVAAWRHVHDIFTAVGATNATWVWCPNIDPNKMHQSLPSLYPGDEYVDWTGLDGYNWGTNPAKPDRWRSFNELFRSTYQEITSTLAPSKPLMIGEISSTEYGGSKSAWVKDALARIPAEYPKLRALVWFEKYNDGMDWPIITSNTSTTAFAEGLQSSAYTGNTFAGLSASAIQPAG